MLPKLSLILILTFLPWPVLAQDIKPVWVIGQDTSSINDFMSTLSSSSSTDIPFPNGMMVYTAINDLRGLSQEVDHGAGINHADQTLQQYPQMQIVQIGLFMRYMLKEIPQGAFDTNIEQLGEWIKNSGKEVYLRIGYEFDNPENEYAPQEYIQAYRYIVDRLRKQGVKNVYYVWHSIAWKDKTWPAYDPLQWYPGDQYVDWIAISFFDKDRSIEREYMAGIAHQKNKPLMIAESSPFNQHTSEAKLKWMKVLFQYLQEHQVKFLSYINVNWNALPLFAAQQWGDARLENQPILLSTWASHVKNCNSNMIMSPFSKTEVSP